MKDDKLSEGLQFGWLIFAALTLLGIFTNYWTIVKDIEMLNASEYAGMFNRVVMVGVTAFSVFIVIPVGAFFGWLMSVESRELELAEQKKQFDAQLEQQAELVVFRKNVPQMSDTALWAIVKRDGEHSATGKLCMAELKNRPSFGQVA